MSILLPAIIALFFLMILHPLTLILSNRYTTPTTIWRSRELAQIGTIESASSLGRIANDGYGFSSMILQQPIWIVEVSYYIFLLLFSTSFLPLNKLLDA